jgi:peptide-methionine (S)-S-oxide reductase
VAVAVGPVFVCAAAPGVVLNARLYWKSPIRGGFGRQAVPRDAGLIRADEGPAMETATFGAGCFWGVEAAFRQIKGVSATAVGYAGGVVDHPTYQQVCSDRTGHAEVVEVTYDPAMVPYDTLLKVFWENHDPTTLNRQGPDVGSQYRSAIFFHSSEQQTAAIASRDVLQQSGRLKGPIVTEIVPAQAFWPAEDYHQQYLEKRGLSTCHLSP